LYFGSTIASAFIGRFSGKEFLNEKQGVHIIWHDVLIARAGAMLQPILLALAGCFLVCVHILTYFESNPLQVKRHHVQTNTQSGTIGTYFFHSSFFRVNVGEEEGSPYEGYDNTRFCFLGPKKGKKGKKMGGKENISKKRQSTPRR